MALTLDEARKQLNETDEPANVILYGKFNPLHGDHGRLLGLGMELASVRPNTRLGVFYPPQTKPSKTAFGTVKPDEVLSVSEQILALSKNASQLTEKESQKLESELLLGKDRQDALETVVASIQQRKAPDLAIEVGPKKMNLSNLSGLFDHSASGAVTYLVAGTDRAGPGGAYNAAIKDGQYIVAVDRPIGATSSSKVREAIKNAKTVGADAAEIGYRFGLHTATPRHIAAKAVNTHWKIPDELSRGLTRRVIEQAERKAERKAEKAAQTASKTKSKTKRKAKRKAKNNPTHTHKKQSPPVSAPSSAVQHPSPHSTKRRRVLESNKPSGTAGGGRRRRRTRRKYTRKRNRTRRARRRY